MKKITLILGAVLMWVNCFGAGLTQSSLNGVATNETRYGTSTNFAIPQPAGGSTNVEAIDSTGHELSIPIGNFSGGGGGGTIASTTNLLVGDGSGNAISSGIPKQSVLTNNIPTANIGTVHGELIFPDVDGSLIIGSADGTHTLTWLEGMDTWVFTDDVKSSSFSGVGTLLTSLNASQLTSGTVGTARLGTGTANSTTFLAGDSTWKSIAGGSGTLTNVLYTNAGPADTYTVGPNAYLKTNSFGGGGITALTGDVTASGSGSVVSTLANIPTSTPMAGSLFDTAIVAPATPASGKGQIYEDSTSKNLAIKNDAGVINHGIQTRTATANQWIRSIADDGSTTISQPAFTDISGTAAAAQLPLATTSAFGAVKPDGTTILVTAGVISSVGSGGTTVTNLNPLVATNTGPFSFLSIYGTGSIANHNEADFVFDGTNLVLGIAGDYAGTGTHTNYHAIIPLNGATNAMSTISPTNVGTIYTNGLNRSTVQGVLNLTTAVGNSATADIFWTNSGVAHFEELTVPLGAAFTYKLSISGIQLDPLATFKVSQAAGTIVATNLWLNQN